MLCNKYKAEKKCHKGNISHSHDRIYNSQRQKQDNYIRVTWYMVVIVYVKMLRDTHTNNTFTRGTW